MIDWNRVSALRDEVGPSEFEPVLELFLDEIEGLVMLLSMDDPAKLARDLHFLKGSACNLGFDAFATLCDDYEARIGRGELKNISLDEIVICYSLTKQMFIRDLPRVTEDNQQGRADTA
ncbi:Hpt domain-containing protein [Paracoccus tegillarcae]|uniref:Histidine kinase n=1 Tax=Paracoccus tegillarcae TaxID=1529068 RepID=A0A2K9EH27_9RHOB|nr:Hpt domain-containing protein [Paracoccus tegillarcae]AUH32617.1 histidine kinase [Paracoccus tegillarcae]